MRIALWLAIYSDSVPLDWATTQNNLGNALRCLGEREKNPKLVEKAIEAYRSALEVFTESQATYYIEGAQNNLRRAEALLKTLK
jgi:tetratricopeptide (TPR) repeat protein